MVEKASMDQLQGSSSKALVLPASIVEFVALEAAKFMTYLVFFIMGSLSGSVSYSLKESGAPEKVIIAGIKMDKESAPENEDDSETEDDSEDEEDEEEEDNDAGDDEDGSSDEEANNDEGDKLKANGEGESGEEDDDNGVDNNDEDEEEEDDEDEDEGEED